MLNFCLHLYLHHAEDEVEEEKKVFISFRGISLMLLSPMNENVCCVIPIPHILCVCVSDDEAK